MANKPARQRVNAADSEKRRALNEVIRNRFGTSSSNFSSCYELLEPLDTTSLEMAKLKSTVIRKDLEKELEIAQVWAQVWRTEAAAARLKMARLNAGQPEARARIAAQLEVARCDLKVKSIEEKIANLKETELGAKVTAARTKEEADREKVPDLTETIKNVKDFGDIIAKSDRKTWFYSYCKQEGHAPWYCQALLSRKSWVEYPSVKWFITKKEKQLYAPLYNATVDFTDQHVYSRCIADLPGHDILSDKGKLGTLMLPFTPRTWHIKDGKWVGEVPPLLPPGCKDPAKSVWFMKDTLRNYSTGIFIVRSTDQCLKIAEEKTAYVVQPMIWPLIPCCDRPDVGPRKHHLRIYFLMHSPRGSADVTFYMYHDGYFAAAVVPFVFDNMDRDVQISRDRIFLLTEWNLWTEIKPKVVAMLQQLGAAAKPHLRPLPEKSCFMVLGLDVMLDPDLKPWLFECNAGPVLREADAQKVKEMMNIVCPEGAEPAPDQDEKWIPLTKLKAAKLDSEQGKSEFSNSTDNWVRIEKEPQTEAAAASENEKQVAAQQGTPLDATKLAASYTGADNDA